MIGSYPLAHYAISSEPAVDVAVISNLDVIINSFEHSRWLQQGSLEIERQLNGRGTATFTLVNPQFVPQMGQVVRIRRYGSWRFGGTIERIRSELNVPKTLIIYRVDCVDWTRTLERRLVNWEVFNMSAHDIIHALLSVTLANENVYEAFIEDTPVFPYVKMDNIRYNELFNDLADGAGMSWWVDPDGGVHFLRLLYPTAPFTLGDGTIADAQLELSREQYRNVQSVTVSGTPPEDSGLSANAVTQSRQDDNELWNRYITEGGTGHYEAHERLTHPASNDPIELQKLAITYCVFRLRRSGRIGRPFSATCFRFGLEPGMLAPVNIPLLGLNNNAILVTRVRDRHVDLDFWEYEVEGTFTDPNELVNETYLRMLQAGRAIMVMPVGIFTGTNTFASSGSHTITGTGTKEVQIVVQAAGGGGGGYDFLGARNGGKGGNGGKSASFRTYPAGTILTITIGAAGTGGAGSSGSTLLASHTTPGTYDDAIPGTGNVTIEIQAAGAGAGGGGGALGGTVGGAGGNGGAVITRMTAAAGATIHSVIGSGGAGGAALPGPGGGTGATGTAGGTSTISIAGTDYAVANGGSGGTGASTISGVNSPGTNGVCGGGGGNVSIIPCGGGLGGVGGGFAQAGGTGGNGRVDIYYADSNPGTGGGEAKVELGAILVASAAGGFPGAAGCDGGAGGTDGGGFGDQVQTGAGRPGGDGGWSSVINGQNGTTATVEIIY